MKNSIYKCDHLSGFKACKTKDINSIDIFSQFKSYRLLRYWILLSVDGCVENRFLRLDIMTQILFPKSVLDD